MAKARAASFRVGRGGGGGGEFQRQTSKNSQLGGGGMVVWGYALPENFDFNPSQIPKNAFKINRRNP